MNYSWHLDLRPEFHSKQQFQDSPIGNSDSCTGLTRNPINGVLSARTYGPNFIQNSNFRIVQSKILIHVRLAHNPINGGVPSAHTYGPNFIQNSNFRIVQSEIMIHVQDSHAILLMEFSPLASLVCGGNSRSWLELNIIFNSYWIRSIPFFKATHKYEQLNWTVLMLFIGCLWQSTV